jgi:hypothetical protein
VIDDNDGIGVPRRQPLGLVETTPNQHVHRQAVLSRSGQDAVDAGVGGAARIPSLTGPVVRIRPLKEDARGSI